jgi:hypothetical protein
MKADENVEKVRTLMQTDHSLGIRIIAEDFNVDEERVKQILRTNVNIKCVPNWSQRIHQFTSTKRIPTVEHALYSPDLAHATFFPGN